MKRYLAVLVVVLMLPGVSSAQEDDCTAFIDRALSDVAARCRDTTPGEACFGHGEVAFTTLEDSVEFVAAGNTLALDTTCCMQLSPLQLPDSWGVAVMKVQPDAGAGPLTYALFGDVEIHNAASLFREVEARVESDTTIYAGPGSHYEVLANVSAGDILHANACNCTQNWLRVRLDSGEIGWVPSRRVTVLGEVGSLPVAKRDTPVYGAMQAFTFRSGSGESECAAAPENGILIQAPPGQERLRLWVNGVDITLGGTVFLQGEPEGNFTIEVLDGNPTIQVGDETITPPAGIRVSIPLSTGYAPGGHLSVTPYSPADIAHLPVLLLPADVDPAAAFDNPFPLIIGQKTCNVVSDQGDTSCALHFVNLDGDAITRMTVEFIYAAQGEWEGSVHESPSLLDGTSVSGDLEWKASCSLGGANFIGPVVWSITITDASGHVSEPFEAFFNCVDG